MTSFEQRRAAVKAGGLGGGRSVEGDKGDARAHVPLLAECLDAPVEGVELAHGRVECLALRRHPRLDRRRRHLSTVRAGLPRALLAAGCATSLAVTALLGPHPARPLEPCSLLGILNRPEQVSARVLNIREQGGALLDGQDELACERDREV